MTISYRVNSTDGDKAVEVEPFRSDEGAAGAYLTILEGTDPRISMVLAPDEIAELREILETVADALTRSAA